ncbi:MAG TPA: hypothetical protein VFV23_08530 [Verrucomicrobiae bacterium]|nr:hypothetical protein [Verrucomicrobiae bacterium]
MMNSKNYLLSCILISFALGGIKARAVNPALPSISTNIFNVAKFGALGDGVKDTPQISKTPSTPPMLPAVASLNFPPANI